MPIDSSQHPFTVWRAATLTADIPLSQLLQHVVGDLPENVRSALCEQQLRFLSHRTADATQGFFCNSELSQDGLQYFVHLAPIRLRGRTYEWARWCVAAELAAAYVHFGYPRTIHELALEILDQFCMQDPPEPFRTGEHAAVDMSMYVAVLSSLVRRDAHMHASPLYWKTWVGALTRLSDTEQRESLERLKNAGWLSIEYAQKNAESSPAPSWGIGPLTRALHAGTRLVTPQRSTITSMVGHWLSAQAPSAWLTDAAVQARWPGSNVILIDDSEFVPPNDDIELGDIPF